MRRKLGKKLAGDPEIFGHVVRCDSVGIKRAFRAVTRSVHSLIFSTLRRRKSVQTPKQLTEPSHAQPPRRSPRSRAVAHALHEST